MRMGSICSGVGSCHLACCGLGWETSFFSEIDPFARAVLLQKFPEIPNIGDFTSYEEKEKSKSVDILVGGTPCQSFSNAGRMQGMDDERGGLAIRFVEFAQNIGARWILWENVPSILSLNQGRDFLLFAKSLKKHGYFFTWRILDAKFFGVPQRRRRVFLVGYNGDWRPPFGVLIEPKSSKWNFEKSKRKEQKDPSETRRGFVSSVQENQRSELTLSSKTNSLSTGGGKPGQGFPLVFEKRQDFQHFNNSTGPLLSRDSGKALYHREVLRKLTPLECERLQGLPDNHTQIEWNNKHKKDCPKTRRYKAIGNSFCVPVVRWIFHRVDLMEKIIQERKKQ